ncbi:MAG: metalloregulator ArsR/SmtB family transcription factor [Eubacteriales bacterium]|nr:metalloregulator ArsR/SmtB family transcription factor [Eubacteriales bacterium]
MNRILPHNHSRDSLINKINESMPTTDDFYIVAELFKLLSDASRLNIFWTLCHVEECVINLAAMLDMTSPALSHHLKILKVNKLITSRREGKEVYYKAGDSEQVKVLHMFVEKIMEISCPERTKASCVESTSEEKLSEQEKTIYEVHKYLANNLDKRITIEELAKKFLINTTTLKDTFKAVYGCSIAAHIKEHRMEKAAELLAETKYSVDSISKMVGYATQSKFTVVFNEFYKMAPSEYRRKHTEL